jgi:hypothetical protein
MTAFERFAVGFDEVPWSAVWRAAVGSTIPPMVTLVAGNGNRTWIAIGLFLALLLLLRIGPLVLRRLVRFSGETLEIWASRRRRSKQYDSYQWQKLFWIGLGMVPSLAISPGAGSADLTIAAACLIGGGAGLFFWLRADAARPAKQG